MLTTERLSRAEQRPAVARGEGETLLAKGLFRFAFKKEYGGLHTHCHNRLILRVEHMAEIGRIIAGHNGRCGAPADAISASDIINASLDLAMEHPAAFHPRTTPQNLRDWLGREVYRSAFVHFMSHGLI